MNPSKPPRLPQLDFLRAVAILLVLGRHFDLLPPAAGPVLRGIFAAWQRSGWMGVDLFFVLSGYLISGLLFREYELHGRVKVGRFLIRRGLKIYPAFFALLAFTCIFRVQTHIFSMREAITEAIFVQSYFHGQWPHTWSLAVEEHFYLAAAIVVALLMRRGGCNPFRMVPLAFAITAILCLGLRIICSIHEPEFDPYRLMYPTHLRADGLMFGVFLQYLDQFHHLRFRSIVHKYRLPIAIACAALIAPTCFLEMENFYIHTFGFTSLYLAFGGLLMLALDSKMMANSRPVAWIARIGFFSYSIYLWHFAWLHFALRLVPTSHFWRLWSLYIFGSIAIGIALSRLIEIPVLRLRDWLFPAEAPAIIFDTTPEFTKQGSASSQTPSACSTDPAGRTTMR